MRSPTPEAPATGDTEQPGTTSSSAAAAPPGAYVPCNRWDLLDVPELGRWTPTRRVSVVLPYYDAPDALRLTLEALRHQTYPHDLLEVVVADDGSDPPAVVPDGFDDLDVRIARQDDRGFGLARVRNTGARAATGDVLVFVDCDMTPEPWHVEAHARWHHLVGDAVTIGFRKHVEYDGIGPDDVAAAAAAGTIEPLFGGRDVQVPTWIDGHMVRTDDLTSAHDDLFRIASGGNLGVRTETWWRVGGADESFTQWGAEDTETGWRLLNDGCLFVPERAALCWHQGHGHEPEPSEVESLEQQRAKIAHLIAHRGFRSSSPGRTYVVPRVVVEVPAGEQRRAEVARIVDAVLASDLHDLRVALDVPDDHPDMVWLQRQYGPDPRVVLADPDSVAPGCAVRVRLPVGATLEAHALSEVARRLESADEPLGVLRATVPGLAAGDAHVVATTTRAVSRARRQVDPTDEQAMLARAGELFGQAWMAGGDLGVHALGTAPDAAAAGTGSGAAAGLGSDAALQQAYQLFSQLEPSQRDAALKVGTQVLSRTTAAQRARLIGLVTRLLAVVEVLRGFARVRSPGALLRQGNQLLRASLPAGAYARVRASLGPLVRALRGR